MRNETGLARVVLGGLLDDLIELASIKPHAAASLAEVDLDAKAFGNMERCIAVRTIHDLRLRELLVVSFT